ncbi:CBS domain-containing protein [bacterium]|nr:CBS domain-containing protein [bacterium]
MKIRDILEAKGKHVFTIKAESMVHEAIQLLVEHNIGALLVLDQSDKLVGILSERDILRESTNEERNLRSTPIKDVMTKNVIIGLPDDKTDYTLGVMTKNRIRHLPIMDGENIAGIISLRDVVRAKLDEQEYNNRYLEQYMFGS